MFAIFQDELEAQKSFKAFFTAKIITKYSSERILSICGQKISKRPFKVLYIHPDNRSDHCLKSYKRVQTSRINYIRLHETRKKKQTNKQTNIKYNNFSGLPVEMQLLKASN